MELNTTAVNRHLDQTLASPLFRKAERQARFLRFVVDRTLESDNPLNPDPPIKEFDIGIAVYDRRGDYDPRADPIVRVEAARLRARLREHYEVIPPTEVKIDLPKGGYIPHFTFLEQALGQAQAANATSSGLAGSPVQVSPIAGTAASVGAAALQEGAAALQNKYDSSLSVQPFRSLSTDPEHQNFCEGLTEELLHTLAGQAGLRVIAQSALERAGARAVASRYLIEGSVRHADSRIRVTVHLVDRTDGATKLSSIYMRDLDDIFSAQEELAGRIVADVTESLGSANA